MRVSYWYQKGSIVKGFLFLGFRVAEVAGGICRELLVQEGFRVLGPLLLEDVEFRVA